MTVDCTHPEDLRGPLPYDGKPARPDEWECLACGYVRDRDDDLAATSSPASWAASWAQTHLNDLSALQPYQEQIAQRLLQSEDFDKVFVASAPLFMEARASVSAAALRKTARQAFDGLGATWRVTAGDLLVEFTPDLSDYRSLRWSVQEVMRATEACKVLNLTHGVLWAVAAYDDARLSDLAMTTQRQPGDWLMRPKTMEEVVHLLRGFDGLFMHHGALGDAMFGRRVRVVDAAAVRDGVVVREMPLW